MNIAVDPERLMDFAAYVSDFPKKISTECSEINAAAFRLAQTVNTEDAAEIKKITHNIVRILENADPDLKELQGKLEGYANFIMRIKSITND